LQDLIFFLAKHFTSFGHSIPFKRPAANKKKGEHDHVRPSFFAKSLKSIHRKAKALPLFVRNQIQTGAQAVGFNLQTGTAEQGPSR
jgi:hypothetical protein